MSTARVIARTQERIETATGFEQAARHMLRCLWLVLRAELPRHPLGEQLKLVRTVLHLRDGSGYSALVVDNGGRGEQQGGLGPSTSAYGVLERTGLPIVVDVLRGVATHLDGHTEALPEAVAISTRTRRLLTDRDATLVVCLPALDRTGRVRGMVSAELRPTAEPVHGADPREALPTWKALDPVLTDITRTFAPQVLAWPLDGSAPLAQAPPSVAGARMRPLLQLLAQVACFDRTILLRGETGVGKTHLARWIHEQSPRGRGPFVSVQLHTLPDALLDGELFGWRKDAFTGAARDHQGFVARAHGGTLFIDEIDRLGPAQQDKLLRLLDERVYRPLGSEDGQDQEADLRFVVGTNADLAQRVADGAFRRDLYYRITQLDVVVPPLRERRDELGEWAALFLERVHREHGRPGSTELTPAAVALLEEQPWPGNLRELVHVVERAWMCQPPLEPGCTLDAPHIERALLPLGASPGPATGTEQHEAGPQPTDPMGALRHAARLLVAVNVARTTAGHLPLPLGRGGLLRDLVWLEAAARYGDAEGMQLMGEAGRVRSRNQGKALAQAMARVTELERALSEGGQVG